MLLRDIYMNGAAGNQIEPIPPEYHFATALNSTAYNLTLYRTTDQSLGSRIVVIPPFTVMTVPLPPGLAAVLVAWSGSSTVDKATLMFTEDSLNLNQSFSPPSGVQSVTITGGTVDVTDRAARQLGQVSVPAGVAVTNIPLQTAGFGGFPTSVITSFDGSQPVTVVTASGNVLASHAYSATTTPAALPVINGVQHLMLMAHPNNTDFVYIGNATEQALPLAAGAGIVLDIFQAQTVYYTAGSGTQTLAVFATN